MGLCAINMHGLKLRLHAYAIYEAISTCTLGEYLVFRGFPYALDVTWRRRTVVGRVTLIDTKEMGCHVSKGGPVGTRKRVGSDWDG